MSVDITREVYKGFHLLTRNSFPLDPRKTLNPYKPVIFLPYLSIVEEIFDCSLSPLMEMEFHSTS